jgi:tRNA-splicing ligase RtcB
MPGDPRLRRLDPTRLKVVNDQGIDATLFAAEEVPVETAAVHELLGMLRLRETVDRFADASPACFDSDPAIDRVAVTPDFHKAAGIPVGTVLATRGFVVPQAIGNDVNCGMRLHVTSLPADPGRVVSTRSAPRAAAKQRDGEVRRRRSGERG